MPLLRAAQECAAQLQPVEKEIKQGVQQAAVAHFDETGLRVENERGWLHVACTTALTFYAYHIRRGKAATDEIGILPGFDGRAIHDGLTSYPQYGCQHGLCNAQTGKRRAGRPRRRHAGVAPAPRRRVPSSYWTTMISWQRRSAPPCV